MQPSDLDGRRTLPVTAVQRVQLLAGAIRDREPEPIEKLLLALDRQELLELAFTAAAMIPVDCSPSELLRWNDTEFATQQQRRQPQRVTAECGTPSGWARHQRLGELPCSPCREARRAFDAECYQRRRRLTLVGGA